MAFQMNCIGVTANGFCRHKFPPHRISDLLKTLEPDQQLFNSVHGQKVIYIRKGGCQTESHEISGPDRMPDRLQYGM